MIDKMSAAHSRPIGVDNSRPIGGGHSDMVRSRDNIAGPQNAGMETGVNRASGNLAGAIDHMVRQGMPVDMQRIMSIREAIADGQYPVDPMMVADKMIEFDKSGGDFS